METPPTNEPPKSPDSAALAGDIMSSLSAAPQPAAPPQPPKVEPAKTPPAEPPKAQQQPTEPAKPLADKKPPVDPAKQPPAQPPKTAKPIDLEDPKLSAPELRRHLKQVLEDTKKTIAEKDSAHTQVLARLRELESKKYWTEDDQKKFEELSKGKAALEAQIYARDYSQSPEYKKQFQDKLDEQFADAKEVVSSLTVKSLDRDGNESERAGTEQDLLKLYKLTNLAERKKAAKEMFGDEFQEALDAVAPMIETRRAADRAIAEKRENYEAERKAAEENWKTQSTQIQSFMGQAFESLQQKEPEIFGFSEEDKEGTEALQRGLQFVDEATLSSASLNPTERAAKAAVLRAMAGAFPRVKIALTNAKARIAELESEIAKFKGTDPGNAGDGGAGGVAEKQTAGTDDLAAEIASGKL